MSYLPKVSPTVGKGLGGLPARETGGETLTSGKYFIKYFDDFVLAPWHTRIIGDKIHALTTTSSNLPHCKVVLDLEGNLLSSIPLPDNGTYGISDASRSLASDGSFVLVYTNDNGVSLSSGRAAVYNYDSDGNLLWKKIFESNFNTYTTNYFTVTKHAPTGNIYLNHGGYNTYGSNFSIAYLLDASGNIINSTGLSRYYGLGYFYGPRLHTLELDTGADVILHSGVNAGSGLTPYGFTQVFSTGFVRDTNKYFGSTDPSRPHDHTAVTRADNGEYVYLSTGASNSSSYRAILGVGRLGYTTLDFDWGTYGAMLKPDDIGSNAVVGIYKSSSHLNSSGEYRFIKLSEATGTSALNHTVVRLEAPSIGGICEFQQRPNDEYLVIAEKGVMLTRLPDYTTAGDVAPFIAYTDNHSLTLTANTSATNGNWGTWPNDMTSIGDATGNSTLSAEVTEPTTLKYKFETTGFKISKISMD